MTKCLSIRYERQIVWLTLDRPERGNALSATLIERMSAEIDRAYEEDIVMLAFVGAGEKFCTGFDLTEIDQESEGDLVLRLIRIESLLQKIYAAPFITAALATGDVVGAGADLFVTCDHRFATLDATFAFPGAAFGLLLGTRRMIDRVGCDAARAIIRSGRTVKAAEAVSLGLATAETTADEFTKVVERIARAEGGLTRPALAGLHGVSRGVGEAEAMAELVMSASRPGLKERISSYRKQQFEVARQLQKARIGFQ